MAIKYNWHDLQKRIINGHEVQKVMYNWNQIRPTTPPVPTYDYLNFTAVDGDVDIKLRWPINLTPPAINFEVSWDRESWIDYTLWDNITVLEWRTLYWRNKSDTPDWESGWAGFFSFYMSWTWKVEAHWSVMYLLCKIHSLVISFTSAFVNLFKNCDKLITAPELPATTLGQHCYDNMFSDCTNLTTPPALPATTLADYCYYFMFFNSGVTTVPELPATTLTNYCYTAMFANCTNLVSIPRLPATTLTNYCYANMFNVCPNIKLSDQQWGIYQTPYMIPSSWWWTTGNGSLNWMFDDTWWEWKWTPNINQTYYTSNQVI